MADLDYTTFRLHPLKGDLKGFWSMTVRANWRIVLGSRTGRLLMLTLWTTIEGGEPHADEEPATSRRDDRG
jgi:hypothetical protein